MDRLKNPLFLLLILSIAAGCANSPNTLFKKISARNSNINFVNAVTENDSVNPIKLEFLYNGGGVAAGDFNNDGLQDLYFTAGMTSNKLYLNKGDFEFEDITATAGVTGEGMWSNGATVVDINNDGLPDIYVSTTINKNPANRRNLFYINQGSDKNGIPAFLDRAKDFGLADTSYSVQALFLDYDRDGDLDMYLATTKPTSRNIYTFGNRKDSSRTDYDKLYRNDLAPGSTDPVFTDVSIAAGISEKGYGLGVSAGDVNNDGWPDIYVTNDFISSDHLYINNRNGTFSNRVKESLRHTSQNAMGNEVSDLNNDGMPDLVAVDMNPEDNFRKQKNMGAANYGKYRNMSDFGYSLQFVRNTMQINQGVPGPLSESAASPVFGDISYYAGVAETDWSWTPSVADFDNDGWKDLLVTNGYPKDVTDHDYVSYRNDKGYIVPEEKLLQQIPEIRVPNYAFRNQPDLRFQNVTASWGLADLSYSSGAAYVDLDNDGDLDYVINNINSAASLYQNTADPQHKPGANFLDISFKGPSQNRNGIGASVTAWYNGQPHLQDNFPTRGYLSCVAPIAHFGLEALTAVDSVAVNWPDGSRQLTTSVKANQSIVADITMATPFTGSTTSLPTAFHNITEQTGINFVHTEYDFIDFDYQRLLPHKLSEYGPALAAADVNGDGLDDLFISGPKGKSASFFLQQPNGSFAVQPLETISNPQAKGWEETGILLIDLDNDGDRDLYLCSGSNEFTANHPAYRDRIFINNGKGKFTEEKDAIPENLNSKQVIKSADFDMDGDPDLFIGSRGIPHQWPKPGSGFIYRNDSKGGKIHFTDITNQVAPELKDLGMITDATWTDFNNDGKVDLVICGEFMPVTFFVNTGGRLTKQATGLEKYTGLWNSITPADIDNDGQMDYIVGNLGLNSLYKGTAEQPFTVYANDFDKNGSFDAIPFLYLKDGKGTTAQYPAFTRDDMIKQLTRTKGQFPTYKSFAVADLNQILTNDEQQNALKVTASYMESAILKNNGNGSFIIQPLPSMAQWSPVFGVLADDFNGDGNIDLLVNTNDLGTEVNTGQYDALNGLFLQGNGKGDFETMPMQSSGFYIPSNGKAIVRFLYKKQYTIAVSQNRGRLLFFRPQGQTTTIKLAPGETSAEILYKNGRNRREEFYEGSSFLSQSAHLITVPREASHIKIFSLGKPPRNLSFE